MNPKKVVFVVAPEGFNDYEFLHPKAILEKSGVEVTVASTVVGRCRGMRGATVESTVLVDEVTPAKYDGVVVVGGSGSLRFLSDNVGLISLLKGFNAKGKIVSAIGRGRHALCNAGLFGTNFAWGPEVEIDGNVIAARPPATTPGWTSEKFGELLVKRLQRQIVNCEPVGSYITDPGIRDCILIDCVEDIRSLYNCKTLSKCFKKFEKAVGQGHLYSIDGYSLTSLELYKARPYEPLSCLIGARRIQAWTFCLQERYPRKKHFQTHINPIDEHGVDVSINKYAMPHTVIGLTNYSSPSYISYEDVQRYINQLDYWDKYDCCKVIVVSYAGGAQGEEPEHRLRRMLMTPRLTVEPFWNS